MKKRLIVKKDGNITTHYLRPYIGILPVGFKVISEVFEEKENGIVDYMKYSADASHLIQEGSFRLNPTTHEKYKIGTWKYYDPTFKYYSILIKEEKYDEKGKKVKENQWTSISEKSIVWKDGIVIENISKGNIFKERIITDTQKGTRETQFLNVQNGILLHKVIESQFNQSKNIYLQSDTFAYDGKTGRLIRCERKMPFLRDMYIIESYPETKPAFFEYAEKRYGQYMTLFSSLDKSEVYQHYLSHLKLSKKDCKKRQAIISDLRLLPTLQAKKAYLKSHLFIQSENYRGV